VGISNVLAPPNLDFVKHIARQAVKVIEARVPGANHPLLTDL
jgi:hypothetical protein